MTAQEIIKNLRTHFESSRINWLEASEICLKGKELHILFLNPFAYDWFKKNIEAELINFIGANFPSLSVVTRQLHKSDEVYHDTESSTSNRSELATVSDTKKAFSSESDYFADFIFNEKNLMAVKAAHSLAENNLFLPPPRLALFFGPSGSGKSHLLKAIYQKCLASGRQCSLFSAGDLLKNLDRSLVWSAFSKKSPSFLIIDDLQYLDASPASLSFLTGLCDRALNPPKLGGEKTAFTLVLAIAAESLKMAKLPRGLESRLEQGLLFALKPADLDIRLRFAEQVNRKKNLGLNRSLLVSIARQATGLTDIIGLLHKIEFFVTLQGRSPSMRDLENFLAPEYPASPPDWQKIVGCVARRLDLKTEDILGNRRKPDFVQARQIAMYLARIRLALSFQEIGKLFGGRDHSTVMHAVKKIQHLRQTDEDLHNLLTELETEAG